MRQNELRSTFSSLLLLSVISIVFLVKTSNSQHCGSVFKAGQGSFWSPGYNAAGYSANSNCVWTITTTPGKLIKFGFFQAFDVEESSHCRMDYVAIYDGIEQSERTLLGRYCGVFQAPLLLSMSDKMTIELRSDYKTNGNGFLGSWISEEPSSYTTNQNLGLCGGIIEPGLNRKFMQNEITSMGYPKKEYRNRNACLWEFRLNRESMKGVEFRVGGIDIEHSPGCRFDHLSVFNRTMVTGEQGVFAKTDTAQRLCGKNSIAPFTVYGDSVFVQFATDAAGSGKGFSLSYKVITGARDLTVLETYRKGSDVKNAPTQFTPEQNPEIAEVERIQILRERQKEMNRVSEGLGTVVAPVVAAGPVETTTLLKSVTSTTTQTKTTEKAPQMKKPKKTKKPKKPKKSKKNKCPKTCPDPETSMTCALKHMSFIQVRKLKGSSKKGYRVYGKITESWIHSSVLDKKIKRKSLKTGKTVSFRTKCKTCLDGKGMYVFTSENVQAHNKKVVVKNPESFVKLDVGRLEFRSKYFEDCGTYARV